RRSRVTQSFDQPSRARKRTSCALWRGSVRMESAAWQAEWRVSRQATTKRVSRPTVEAGSLAAAKNALASGRESAKITGGLAFCGGCFWLRVTLSPDPAGGKRPLFLLSITRRAFSATSLRASEGEG